MARAVELQAYRFFACERCDFAYKDAATADRCALFDLEHGRRSMELTKESIAPPQRHWQAVLKFIEEELKAAKKAAAPPPAAKVGGAPGAAAATAPTPGGAGKPALTQEEIEARKKAALEKAAAAQAAASQGGSA
jgi:hypothetical protein